MLFPIILYVALAFSVEIPGFVFTLAYHTLLSQPDDRVFGELTFSRICDALGSSTAAYVGSCVALDVAYHLVYHGEGVTFDHTPQRIHVNSVCLDGSPALTEHYIVDMLPAHDDLDPLVSFVFSGRQSIPL